jgi:hypothetical protein
MFFFLLFFFLKEFPATEYKEIDEISEEDLVDFPRTKNLARTSKTNEKVTFCEYTYLFIF